MQLFPVVGLQHLTTLPIVDIVNDITTLFNGKNPMVNPNLKTEYPTHSTVGGYTIAYITTDGECHCGNCIVDVVESDIYLLPESRIRDYDYPIPTILHDDTEEFSHVCDCCHSDIGN